MKRLLLLALLACQGCVEIRERDQDLFQPRFLEDELPAGARVHIRIPAGEVEITNSSDSVLSASLTIRCDDLSGSCAGNLSDVDFVYEDIPGGGGVRLSLSEDRARRYRQSSVEVKIAVPEGRPLTIDLTAGDLDIAVSNCLTADVEAGDVDLLMPPSSVKSIHLDAGVGDARLTAAGFDIAPQRSMLVGAEVHWTEGGGSCDIKVDLQAGDIRAELR
ncbi:MAG: hypothetical protein R3200_07950 [Xanthomonadales bacterium]|nr:hypothetical protein [Xanthomonadales bacterium]